MSTPTLNLAAPIYTLTIVAVLAFFTPWLAAAAVALVGAGMGIFTWSERNRDARRRNRQVTIRARRAGTKKVSQSLAAAR